MTYREAIEKGARDAVPAEIKFQLRGREMPTMSYEYVDIVAAILSIPLMQQLVPPEPSNVERERQLIVDNYFATRRMLLEQEIARQTPPQG